MLSIFKETNLQGGFSFFFKVLSSDREFHSRIVRKSQTRYASRIYLSPCNPKCFYDVMYES